MTAPRINRLARSPAPFFITAWVRRSVIAAMFGGFLLLAVSAALLLAGWLA